MSTRVAIEQPGAGQLRIELRQSRAEVAQFVLFIGAILTALYLLVPRARDLPGPLLALFALGAAWATIALGAREVYAFDGNDGTIDAVRSSLLGRRHRRMTWREVALVRYALGGTDDGRRLVELVGADGKVRMRLPWRLNTMSARHQEEIGRLIAGHMSIPLRGSPDV